MQNKLFSVTRSRLALYYGAAMGLIVILCGFTIYQLIAHTRWLNIEREIDSVAEALQETIEPALKQPGKLEPSVKQMLPGICLAGERCLPSKVSEKINFTRAEQKILSSIDHGGYCMRLLDKSHRLIALSQFPSKEQHPCSEESFWQTLKEPDGDEYHQISRLLYTQNHLSWGTMQIGRSLDDLDEYLFSVQLILWLSILLAIALVSVASWWLAGFAMQPIHQSYQQMQQFTADAAHELRTPVSAIRATVQAALSQNEFAETQEIEPLQTIERQSRRLSLLVQDLLLLCSIDQQISSVQKHSCCLNDLLSQLVEDFEALAMAADVILVTDIRANQPLYAIGNSEQLYRLFSNLIVNAIQYTKTGGQITVVLDKNDRQILIQVKDTGIGIAQQEQTRIFDRFYRVQQDRSRHTGGSGLGLAIANAIVKVHHGCLQLESELGKGSIFTVRLPGNGLKSIDYIINI